MSNESWKRRGNDNRRFTVPRIEDDEALIDEFLDSRIGRPGPAARILSGLFGIITVVSLCAVAVFFGLRAFGLDLEYVDAVIIAATGTFIRHLDAAVMRNIRQ